MSEDITPYGNNVNTKLHDKSEMGIDISSVSDFQETYYVTKKQMAYYLGVSEKTYYNIMNEPQLDTHRSDKFLQINKVFEEGTHTFMGKDGFLDWLNAPQLAFDQRRPCELLHTFSGLEAINTELQRIKYGILA